LKKFYINDNSGNRSGSFGGTKALRETSVNVEEEYNAKIEDMSPQGNAGVAKIEGFVIFDNNARHGERVMIKITKVGNGYATAEVLNQIIKKVDTKQEMGTNETQ
jgi:predicted RNA-binding protein with TRAM domain